MDINYEILVWVLVVSNVATLGYLISLVGKINELMTVIGVKSKVFKDTIDEFKKQVKLGMTDLIVEMQDHDTDMTTKLNLLEADVGEIADEILGPIVVGEGDEDEDEKYPEPGEAVILDEIAVEIDEDPIHIITPNQFFFENNGHTQYKLDYYASEDSVYYYYSDTTDEHIILGNVAECIGDALKYFGVNSRNDKVVYVRNNVFKADFMIERMDD